MNKQRFEEIQKMTDEQKQELSKEELSEFYDYLQSTSSSSVSIPTEVYIEAGVEVATESLMIATNTSEKILKTTQELAKGVTPTQTVGTVGKVAIFLSLATNIYSMVKGSFKWDLINVVNLVSSTLACLVLLGVNIACMGALATILASNPFTIGLAVVVILINYFNVGEIAEKIKKTYLSCFNSYRRIYKLCNWADTNEVIYRNFKSVLDFAKNEVLKIKEDFINSEYYNLNMRRKIFVGADFNSFVLFNNVITFIQAKQELSTAKDGTYNDYIDFCSIEDYIDTHEIMQQDLARIEYFILQNDLKGLKDFVISIDFLSGYFDTYKQNKFLTFNVRKDIDFVLSCVSKLKSAIGEKGLTDLKNENSQFKNVRNPQELFNSIYSYLIYANSMRNSPFTVSKTLLNPEYYQDQNIYEYVSAFSEYPVYLFSNWYFYFGNIMFNDVYIEKYKTELISAYNLNNSLYTETFYKDLINDINSYDDFKVSLIWLYSIKEFLQNLLNYEYNKYSPYFATSFTQSGQTEDGKTLYNYYLPENEYLIPEVKTVIENFVKYFKMFGYEKEKFSSILDNFNILKNFDIKTCVPFIKINNTVNNCVSGTLGKIFTVDNSIVNLRNKKLEELGFYAKSFVPDYIRYLSLKPKDFIDDKQEFDINEIDYYGLSENIKDFYVRILLKTKDIRYLYTYIYFIYDERFNNDWLNCFNDIAYLLSKSQDLRELFFSGYSFQTTKDPKIFVQSLYDFLHGQRQDIIFYFKDSRQINIETFVDYMISTTYEYKKYLEEIYNGFKVVYNDYRNTINNDYNLAVQIIKEKTSDFLSVLDKYPQFDSALSYAYTGKYDVYLWNIYKMAQSLGLNNKSYLTNIERHLVPVYKLENGFIQLETYYSPMFILLSSKDDTDLSQSYYLVNQEALNNLFNIGNEKFEEKIKEYKDLVSLTIQPEIAVIDHKEIISNISENIKTMYSLNKEQMIDLLGSQQDEFIMIQNLLNQEILQKVVDSSNVVSSEILNAYETNKGLADTTQNKINENKRVIDKNAIIKYAMFGGLALILLNRGK